MHKPRPDLEAELLRLLDGGRQLEAVKLYKERRGVPLMEAKQAVESLTARHGLMRQRAGCMGMVLAVVLVAVPAAVSLGMTMYYSLAKRTAVLHTAPASLP